MRSSSHGDMAEVIRCLELRAAVRLALHATASTSKSIGIAEGSPPRQDGSQFRELVADVLFSRRFILTYQAVIVCLLAVFTIAY